MMRCAAVIAAAGLSSRMSAFKPMLCLGEQTIITTVIQNLRDAGIGEIVVVTGYKTELLRHHLQPFHVRICENKSYAETKMYDSLCMGLRALEEPYDYVLLTPGDVPLVQPKTIQQVCQLEKDVVRPVCDGRGGHPIKLSARMVPELFRYHGGNGLRGALSALSQPVCNINVDDAGVLLDVDTPEDLKTLHKEEMLLRGGGHLWPDIRIHILKSDVILTPETAQYLEMIEHTGSIQSACACVHISYTKGWKLLNQIELEFGSPLVLRSTGGASGGGSVLTPEGKQLLFAYQCFRDQLQKEAARLFEDFFGQKISEAANCDAILE